MAEKQYNSDKFVQAVGNIKQTWQNINIVINGRNDCKRQTVQEIKSDHNLITDSKDISHKRNDFSSILLLILKIKYIQCLTIDLNIYLV